MLATVITAIRRDATALGKKTKIGILSSGGFNSTLLTFVCAKHRPTLYFAAIISPFTRNYNKTAIQTIKTLAQHFKIHFKIIPITKQNYLDTALLLSKSFSMIPETDTPAVYYLLKKIKQLNGHQCLLSGMGCDDILNLRGAQLSFFWNHKAPREILLHQKLARMHGLLFRTPFINKDFLKYSLNTGKNKNKKLLRQWLKTYSNLPLNILNKKSQHSQIPKSFFTPLTLSTQR